MQYRFAVLALLCAPLVMSCGGSNSSPAPLPVAPSPPSPPPAPTPPSVTVFDIPKSAWLVFTEGDDIPTDLVNDVSLTCDGETIPVAITVLGDGRVVINPEVLLPEGGVCTVTAGSTDVETFEVSTAENGQQVVYDRDSNLRLGPLPDDVFLTPDPTTASGSKLSITVPTGIGGPAEQDILNGAITNANFADGWSPTGTTSVSLTGPIDPQTLPSTVEESIDPLSTIAWFNITPGSPRSGERIPFKVEQRIQTNPNAPGDGERLVLIPSVRLEPENIYGVIISNRVLDEEGGPLLPSAAFASSLGQPQALESANISAVRSIALPTLDAINQDAAVGYDTEDVALILRMTIRSGDVLTADAERLAALSRQRPLPVFTLDSIDEAPGTQGLIAIIRGTIDGTSYTDPSNANRFNRNNLGEIIAAVSKPLDIVIALPITSATSGPPPVIAFLHGSPGDAENLVQLGGAPGVDGVSPFQAGYAVIAISLENNDGLPPSATNTSPTGASGAAGPISGFAVRELQNVSEILEFLRWVKSEQSFDLFPNGGDGVADFDPSWLGYYGVSAGANRGMQALPYTTDVDAAVLTVGGLRSTERTEFSGFILSDQSLKSFTDRGFSVTPNTIGALAPLTELSLDTWSAINHVPRHFEDQIDLGTPKRASILITEGLVDTIAPNGGTRAVASAYGDGVVLQVPVIQESVLVLDEGSANLTANVNSTTTAGFAQFVASGSPVGTVTPGCANTTEGHFCAPVTAEAITQILAFFYTSRTEAAPIIAVSE
ncbi:MAG: hypothetical protein AAGF20_00565 [Pseudomonadota bacterium]